MAFQVTNVAGTVRVQISLERYAVDCPGVLEVHVVGKILLQNAARVVRHAVDTPRLLPVVIVDNTVRMGNVRLASCEVLVWCLEF